MQHQIGNEFGRTISVEITYILRDYPVLEKGYCVLAIKEVTGESSGNATTHEEAKS